MRDFRRRVELRILMERESKMALHPQECVPRLCERCFAPVPTRKRGQGLQKRWCSDCQYTRRLEQERARKHRMKVAQD